MGAGKLAVAGAVALGFVLLRKFSALPSLEKRAPSTALRGTETTRLGKGIRPQVQSHPGRSGIYLLPDGRHAFAARILLARAAERSVDAQYYIWRKDMSGTLLLQALREAADRGIRVRLLLDDHATPGLDLILAALNAHPNIEVRLFNPLGIRKPRWLNYLIDFIRLNRRMHNKSFTTDNQVTIIGGRNVADDYFGAVDGLFFADLDVMAVGPVVQEVSGDFDRYWASGSSYPAERLLPRAGTEAAAELEADALKLERQPKAVAYMKTLRESEFVSQLRRGRLPLEWAPVRMVSDDPAKGLGLAGPDELLMRKLNGILEDPERSLDLVSPYFVLRDPSLRYFTDLSKRGVRVQILTNSLEATDAGVVHAAYAKRREILLKAGIALYELKRIAPLARRQLQARWPDSSKATLHAKTFSVDQARVFVGSFNFDPRSAKLNTEMGFVIESETLARRIHSALAERIPAGAYEVRLDGDGRMYWLEKDGGKVVRHKVEPGVGLWRRAAVWLASFLPIEGLL